MQELAGSTAVARAVPRQTGRPAASPAAARLPGSATAYGLTMAALFEVASHSSRLQRAKDQPVWRDPKAAYLRRQVFLHPANPLELVEVELPANQEAGFPASAYHLIRQVVWVISGRLVLMEGTERHELAAGDRVELGPPSDIVFRNETAQPCRYLVAIARR